MTARFRLFVILTGCAALMCMSGCTAKFWDPPQLGRFRPTPALNVILPSLGVAEEPPMAWEGGEPPRMEDTTPQASDYTLGVGDVLTVSVYELLTEGQWTSNQYEIKGTGQISIPEVGDVKASGLTETQLENRIKDILSEQDVIRSPLVSVALQNSQRRTCSVIGEGVANPGPQLITRNDYRLADALAMARGPYQVNVSYVYVARQESGEAMDMSGQPDLPLNELSVLGPEPQARQYTPPVYQQPTLPAPTQPMMSQPVMSMSVYDQSAYAYQQPQPTFNQEREILGMSTPSMQRLWQESERVMGSSFRQYPYNGLQNQVLSAAEFAQTGTQSSPFNFNNGPAAAAPQTGAGAIDWEFRDGKWVPVQRQAVPNNTMPTQIRQPQPAAPVTPVQPQPVISQTQPAAQSQTNDEVPVDWIFENGKWIAVPVGGQSPQSNQADVRLQQNQNVIPLDQSTTQSKQQVAGTLRTRLIKVPADKVVAGDPRYNIVIRPGDTIYVPVDVAGVFYITGQVNGTGPVRLAGPTTLKQAITMAGGLGALAYPKKCEVVRRIGENHEEVVMVDLEKIGKGEQPDFYVKPHDLINVGTHFTSRWRAVMRNAFRAAYGFGFVYDRNFGDASYGKGWSF